uniref:Uncharacterized protein n=1 Tax=Triticum urartu TaxID=4572 RepID=A0A8R7K4U2_TRIUA
MPKSISIRSNGYLKMDRNGKHRVTAPVNVGSVRSSKPNPSIPATQSRGSVPIQSMTLTCSSICLCRCNASSSACSWAWTAPRRRSTRAAAGRRAVRSPRLPTGCSSRCTARACSRRSCATSGRRAGRARTATSASSRTASQSSAPSSATRATRPRSAAWSSAAPSAPTATAATSATPSPPLTTSPSSTPDRYTWHCSIADGHSLCSLHSLTPSSPFINYTYATLENKPKTPKWET